MGTPKAFRYNMRDVDWELTPEFGRGEQVFYRSTDKTRAVVAFKEAGSSPARRTEINLV